MTTVKTVSERIRAEYAEMPGMSLTLEQVARLCGIERSVCQQALERLVENDYLTLKPDGSYTRRSEERRATRMAKSRLRDSATPRINRRASNK